MLSTSFRNTLIASTLLVGASILVSPIAFADTNATDNSGTVTGTITAVSEVVYTAPTGLAPTLSPATGLANMPFGSVNVQDNSVLGWTLTVTSTNEGTLENGAYNIPYTNLDFASASAMGNATDVFASDTTGEVVYDFAVLTCAATGGCTADITADIAGADVDGKPHGTYTDILTFTLTSKL